MTCEGKFQKHSPLLTAKEAFFFFLLLACLMSAGSPPVFSQLITCFMSAGSLPIFSQLVTLLMDYHFYGFWIYYHFYSHQICWPLNLELWQLCLDGFNLFNALFLGAVESD